jgi:hypothetical protein
MSTIPLSLREGHGQTPSGTDAPLSAMHADNDDKLDALIDGVAATIANRDAPDGTRDEILLEASSGDDGDTWRDLKAKLDDPELASECGADSELDRTLKAAVERRASQEAESADFRQSRGWRSELDRRYDGRIAIGDLLDNFADWHERLKQHPRAAADAIVAAYLEQAPDALPDDSTRPTSSGKPASSMSEGADRTLNGILSAAIDRHHGQGDGEQKVFAASARHRNALKEMFPGLSYAEACRRVVKLDGDLHRDPIGTAGRLAATYGMTATPAQQIIAEERGALAGDAQKIVATAVERLPDLANLEDDVIAVMQRPEFKHGPDMQSNLMRAHRVAQLSRGEQTRRSERSAGTIAAPACLDGVIAKAMRGAGPAA